jgi:aromatic-L-amino-acid decarboxylase
MDATAAALLDSLDEAAERTSRLVAHLFRVFADGEGPVSPAFGVEATRAHFRGTLGEEGVGLARLAAELERDVVPRSLRVPHPMYAGLVNSSPLPGAVLADAVVSALNNNAGAIHQGPAVGACEEEAVRALAAALGAGDRHEGLFVPGGTMANLQGIVVARLRAFPGHIPEGARLYTSEAAHFSVARAARVAGLAREAVVALPTRGPRGALDAVALRARLREDAAGGLRPFCVVATLGTTGTGAIDPLAAIADACDEARVWLHVDACYGGPVCLLPDRADLRAALARADSIAVDAHKWLFMPLTAGLFLTRHPAAALDAFDEAASYIPASGAPDAWRAGLPTSRRAAGFVVWAGLRAHGFSAIREAVARNIVLTRLAEESLREHGFEVLPDGELSVACTRAPGDDAAQERIAARVRASGEAWLATVRHAGRVWLRLNFVNLHVRTEHVERLVACLATAARDAAA